MNGFRLTADLPDVRGVRSVQLPRAVLDCEGGASSC
jgi:hypothetical protein